MTTDHRAQVEELLADYRRSRELLGSVQRALAAVSESATSADGTVTATSAAEGRLTGLVIDQAAYQRHRPAELAELVVRTAAAAAAKAAAAAQRELSPILPAGSDPAAVLAGSADLRPEELAPAEPVTTPTGARARPSSVDADGEDDEDSNEDRQTWLSADTYRRTR